MAQAAEDLLTRAQIAKELDTHPQTIEKWKAAGMPVAVPGSPGVPHRYRASECRAWLDAREEARQTSGVIDFERARAEKEHWQARLNEQKFLVQAGELLHVDDVRRTWSKVVSAVRARLLTIPVHSADRIHRVAVMEGESAVEVVLDELMREVLTELAELDADISDEPAKKKSTTKRKPARKRSTKRKAKTAKKARGKKKATRKKR